MKKGAAGKGDAAAAAKPNEQPEGEQAVQEEAKPQFGNGKFEYVNSTTYTGEWKLFKGKKVKHGKGKITFPGAPGQTYGVEEYEGEWKEDKMDGEGRYTFTSGAEYVGSWKEGKMNGTGKMVFADGTSYDGIWTNNLMHGEGTYVDTDGVEWSGIFVNGSFESKIQKKLRYDKELQDRIQAYEKKAMSFFEGFAEAFAKSDKKTYKDNLSPFFVTAETCIDYVAEPYTKYEERLPDRWNEIFKTMHENGAMKVLTQKEDSTILPVESILVEQLRSKPGGQLLEVEATVGDKNMQLVLIETPSEQWQIVMCSEKA